MIGKHTNNSIRYLKYVIGHGFMNFFYGIVVYGFRCSIIGG